MIEIYTYGEYLKSQTPRERNVQSNPKGHLNWGNLHCVNAERCKCAIRNVYINLKVGWAGAEAHASLAGQISILNLPAQEGLLQVAQGAEKGRGRMK